MYVEVVWNLAHYIIDDKLAVAVFVTSDKRKRLDHKRALLLGRNFSMLAEDRHRGVARIAVEQRKVKRKGEPGVPGSIFFELTQIAFGHI